MLRSKTLLAAIATLALGSTAFGLVWTVTHQLPTSPVGQSVSSAPAVFKQRGSSSASSLDIKRPAYPNPSDSPMCGDDFLDPDEECDDGQLNGIGPCTTKCTIQKCGDGILFAAHEECEATLRNYYDDDGSYQALGFDVRSCSETPGETVCSTACKQKFLPLCPPARSSASSAAATASAPPAQTSSVVALSSAQQFQRCGNGTIDDGELCDNGIANGTQPNACRTDCVTPHCGDGIVDDLFGEVCDSGTRNANTPDTCRTNCQAPRCGDGIKDIAEECDGGAQCSSDCQLQGNVANVCGNGAVEEGEECDDANGNDVDECSNRCRRATCGDGVLQTASAEECDDGNRLDSDACTSRCTLSVCGDGIVRTGVEQCEDGNASDGDGCSAQCLHEAFTLHQSSSSSDIQVLHPANVQTNGVILAIISISAFLMGAAATYSGMRLLAQRSEERLDQREQ